MGKRKPLRETPRLSKNGLVVGRPRNPVGRMIGIGRWRVVTHSSKGEPRRFESESSKCIVIFTGAGDGTLFRVFQIRNMDDNKIGLIEDKRFHPTTWRRHITKIDKLEGFDKSLKILTDGNSLEHKCFRSVLIGKVSPTATAPA